MINHYFCSHYIQYGLVKNKKFMKSFITVNETLRVFPVLLYLYLNLVYQHPSHL